MLKKTNYVIQPTSMHIGKYRVPIKFVNHIEDGTQGIFSWKFKTILVDETLNKKDSATVLLHEFTHGAFSIHGFSKYEDNEDIVWAVTHIVLDLLEPRNNHIIEYVRGCFTNKEIRILN